MSKISEQLKSDKPWAILGITRRYYETVKPWKKSNMSRDKFEESIRLFPNEVIQDMKLYASAELLAERLLESMK